MSEPYNKIFVVDSTDISKVVYKSFEELNNNVPYLHVEGETFNYLILATDPLGTNLKFNLTPDLINEFVYDPVNFTFSPTRDAIYRISISFLYEFYTEDAVAPPYSAIWDFVLYRNGSPQDSFRATGYAELGPLVSESATPITLSYVKKLFAGNVYYLLIKPNAGNNINANISIKRDAGNLNVSYICNSEIVN